MSSGLSDPWSIRDDSLRSDADTSDSAIIAASLTRTIAAITTQRDTEFAHNSAETTLRNQSITATKSQNDGIAGASLAFVTADANAYRTAGQPGSLPDLSNPTIPLSGPLSIAGQLSATMPATRWISVVDQVHNRMDDWTEDLYSHSVDYELDLNCYRPF